VLVRRSYSRAAKRGKFLDEVFVIADLLLADEDDMVQKGYGWLLIAVCVSLDAQVIDRVREVGVPHVEHARLHLPLD
jgi:hypothetical protein